MSDDETAETNEQPIDLDKYFESIQSSDNFSDWIKAANYAYDSGQFENAKQYYLRALELARGEPGEQQRRLVCLNRIGEICIKLNQADSAFPILAFFSAQEQRSTDLKHMVILYAAILITAVLTVYSINIPFVAPNGTKLDFAIDQKESHSPELKLLRKNFKTADQRAGFHIAPEAAYVWQPGEETRKSKYVSVNFSLQNILKLLPGWGKRNENFVYIESDYLIDQNGVVFYNENAPELLVVKQMWFYQGLLNAFYAQQEQPHYPTKAADWVKDEVSGIRYVNPFSKKIDIAKFALVTGSDMSPPAVASPGAILIFSNGKRKCTIYAYDRNSRLLTSHGGKTFQIQLENGDKIDDVKQTYFDENVKTFIFIDDPRMKSVMEAAKYFLPALAFPIWLGSLTISLLLYRVFVRFPGRVLAFSPIIAPSVLILLIALMFIGN